MRPGFLRWLPSGRYRREQDGVRIGLSFRRKAGPQPPAPAPQRHLSSAFRCWLQNQLVIFPSPRLFAGRWRQSRQTPAVSPSRWHHRSRVARRSSAWCHDRGARSGGFCRTPRGASTAGGEPPWPPWPVLRCTPSHFHARIRLMQGPDRSAGGFYRSLE